MKGRCRVCGLEFPFTADEGYDPDLCSAFCDGRDGLLRAVLPLVTARNDVEGPSLDYMQGYRDGQEYLQNELKVILNRFVGAEQEAKQHV